MMSSSARPRCIITSWDKEAERTYGYPVREIVGQSISMLVPPERPAVEKMALDPAPRDVDHLFHFPGVRLFLHELDDEAVDKAREKLKREPYKAHMDRLLVEKQEEYRARESSRKLVG